MHPDAGLGLARDCRDSLALSATFLCAVPRVEAVNSDFAPFVLQSCGPVAEIGDVIGSSPARCVQPRNTLASPTLKRNQKVSCWQTVFSLQVPLEGFPEISCPAEINQRERCNRSPGFKQAPAADSAPKQIPYRSDGRPVQKSPHRVIELVLPNANEIDVVCQGHREVVPGWDRGNLHQRDPILEYPCPQHTDVSVERGGRSILGRLAACQEELHLIEQVIA